MKRLESENLELSGKLKEAEKQLVQMERQLTELNTLKTKVLRTLQTNRVAGALLEVVLCPTPPVFSRWSFRSFIPILLLFLFLCLGVWDGSLLATLNIVNHYQESRIKLEFLILYSCLLSCMFHCLGLLYDS